MAKSLTEIQKDSDEKRGVKTKAFKLPLEVIASIEAAASELGVPQNQLIEEAVALYIKMRL